MAEQMESGAAEVQSNGIHTPVLPLLPLLSSPSFLLGWTFWTDRVITFLWQQLESQSDSCSLTHSQETSQIRFHSAFPALSIKCGLHVFILLVFCLGNTRVNEDGQAHYILGSKMKYLSLGSSA